MLNPADPPAYQYPVGAVLPAAAVIGRDTERAAVLARWSGPRPWPNLAFVGHRRCGKSSFVRSLPGVLPAGCGVSIVNLMTVNWEVGLPDLLYALTFALWEADPALGAAPDYDQFQTSPAAGLHGCLRRWRSRVQGGRVLIADEAEVIAEHLTVAEADQLLEWLQTAQLDHAWLTVGFAGWEPLQRQGPALRTMPGWQTIHIADCLPLAVIPALVQPPGSGVHYTPEGLAALIRLTGGQPFYTQAVAAQIADRIADGGARWPADAAQVRAVVGPVLAQLDPWLGDRWTVATTLGQPHAAALLQHLAASPVPQHPVALAGRVGIAPAFAQRQLNGLVAAEILAEQGGYYRFTMDLFRRWVAHYAPVPARTTRNYPQP